MTISVGTRFGRYEIRSQIGAGGMGEVYLAHDTELDRKVAIKILPGHLASDHQRLQRFIQEAKAASALNHPHILTIHEIGVAGASRFIATEFIDGKTLRERMKSGMTFSEIIEIAIQADSALIAAHEAGIIHRDIKPENIMIRRDGYVKLLDFGLAKLTQPDGEPIDPEASTRAIVNTSDGAVMGTANYMSPEQAMGTTVDARTDLWSLGAVLYEMIAGCAPFASQSATETVSLIIQKDPAPLTRFAREVPAELERIINKLLTKNRDERYQLAKDLLVDLRNLKRKLEVQAQSTASVDIPHGPSSAEYLVSEIKRHKAAVIALLIIAAAMIGIAGSFYLRNRGTRTIDSIAVLPFINASGNAELEYLSDGMTESLINSLSQLPNLSVKARSSVFQYKQKEIDAQEVASQLSVQAVLNGRVVQRADELTLYLSLVDGRTGNQLWGEQYERKMADLVSLQSEIARDVSSKLRARLSGAEQQKMTKNYTADSEAYQLYLRGHYNVQKLTPSGVNTGISYFQEALRLDPSYALAYVGLADAYRASVLSSGEMSPTEFLPKSKAAAQKAIEIDDALAEAHTSLAFTIFWNDWDWPSTEKEAKRAIELSPNYAEAHLTYAHYLLVMERYGEAVAETRLARELEPLNFRINTLEAQFLIIAGKTDEALSRIQKTFELDQNFWFAHLFASSAYLDKRMFPEAAAEARKAKELSASTFPDAFLGYALAKSGHKAEAESVLEDLLKQTKVRYVPPYHIALIYNALGKPDETFAWLERGYAQRDTRMVFLKAERKWDNLRDDPRFLDLERRVGLKP